MCCQKILKTLQGHVGRLIGSTTAPRSSSRPDSKIRGLQTWDRAWKSSLETDGGSGCRAYRSICHLAKMPRCFGLLIMPPWKWWYTHHITEVEVLAGRSGDYPTCTRQFEDAPYQSVPTLTRLEAVHLRCNGRRGPHGVQLDLMEAVSALPSLKLLTITNSNTDNLKHSLISPMNFNVVKLDLWHC